MSRAWWWAVRNVLSKRTATLTLTATGGEGGAGAEVLIVDTGETVGYIEGETTVQFEIKKGYTVRITPWTVPRWGTPATQTIVMDDNKNIRLDYVPPNIGITVALWEAAGSAVVRNVTTGAVITTVAGQGSHPIQVPYTHTIRIEPQPVAGYDTPAAREFIADEGAWYEFSYVDNSFVLNLVVNGPVGASINVFNTTTQQAIGSYGAGEYAFDVTSGHTFTFTPVNVAEYNAPATKTQTIGRADVTVTMTYTAVQVAPTAQLVTNGLWGSWKFQEGTGTTTASEAGLPTALTLGADSGAAAQWIPGGGVRMAGGTEWVRRMGDTTLAPTQGVTLTIAVKHATLTNLGRLFHNNSGNRGFTLQANNSDKWIQVVVGDAASNQTVGIKEYVDESYDIICISITQAGVIDGIINGTPIAQKTSKSWVASLVNNLFVGYAYAGDVHYAAVHQRVLTVQERADMYAYAKKVMTDRGITLPF